MKPIDATAIEAVKAAWRGHWGSARAVWGPYVKLQEPIWCGSSAHAQSEGLTGSFAMIRLTDHRIVIDLERVIRAGVDSYPLEVLAHEIGHHIYTPANLRDNAIFLGRIRWSLADLESRAPFVANIYADMLINDRLQRSHQLHMSEVYRQINKDIEYSDLWRLIMRGYEWLWKLPRGTLAGDIALHTPQLDADASLIASLVRSYSKNWMDGAGRFAALLYPYLADEEKYNKTRRHILVLLDTETAGINSGIVGGMTEIDAEAISGAVDPREESIGRKAPLAISASGTNDRGGVGPQQRYLSPGTYIDLQRQANPNADEQLLVNNYYREIALPHLVRFPRDVSIATSLIIPEGVDSWDISDPIEEIDWLETVIASPQMIPGFNTRKRIYGPDDEEPKPETPLDIYIGVDCSGSMGNPRLQFSWPILAATIIALSALRAGSRVMGCLSGEPGSYLESDGFIDSETDILTVLTSYLGTGYAFGVPRLNRPFGEARKTKAHIVIVTDDDLFAMLSAGTGNEVSNWIVIERALKHAGGTGTLVLHARREWHQAEVERLKAMGWNIFYVTNEEELLGFAANFSKTNFETA